MTSLPKLTKPEMARLIKIGKTELRGRPSFRDSPSLTKRLEQKGLVAARGGKIAKTGRAALAAAKREA